MPDYLDMLLSFDEQEENRHMFGDYWGYDYWGDEDDDVYADDDFHEYYFGWATNRHKATHFTLKMAGNTFIISVCTCGFVECSKS